MTYRELLTCLQKMTKQQLDCLVLIFDSNQELYGLNNVDAENDLHSYLSNPHIALVKGYPFLVTKVQSIDHYETMEEIEETCKKIDIIEETCKKIDIIEETCKKIDIIEETCKKNFFNQII